jgi:hypothetical protein
MDSTDVIKALIEEGKRLVPHGSSSRFDGYSREYQSEYVAWRLQTLAALREMGPAAEPFINDLEADSDGPYFYKSAAQRVLGVLQGALAVTERWSYATSMEAAKASTTELNIVWGPLRAILENNFTFANIKEVCGLAGLDLTTLSYLQQKQGSGTSKGHLMTAVDGLLGDMKEDEKRRFITIMTEEVLRRRPNLADMLQDYLRRLGWAVYEGRIVPLEILDLSELPELPDEARPDLAKAAQRLRDGDLSGAISAACGAVDATTSRVYSEKSLGDPGAASFQERVVKSLRVHGILTRLDVDLQALGWDTNKIKPFRENLTKSLNHAAYVMQTLRANMGDVHGSKPILKPLVFDSIKWASLITRLLA